MEILFKGRAGTLILRDVESTDEVCLTLAADGEVFVHVNPVGDDGDDDGDDDPGDSPCSCDPLFAGRN